MTPSLRFLRGSPLEAYVVVTYRCNARCHMCHTWQHPSATSHEFSPRLIEKLPPRLAFINITGGEPFLRSDIETIVEKSLTKAKRVVISSNGYFTNRITAAAKRYGNRIGFRISMEGFRAVNDRLRGMENGFDRGVQTLTSLKAIGVSDLGIAVTVSDYNTKEMIDLYHFAETMGIEFASAVTHNSFYFHTVDNEFDDRPMIAGEFEKISRMLLQSRSPKNWFRAYFNMGLANKVCGGRRPLPCEAGISSFFLDPFGNILPCNGSDEAMVMGNLHHQSFEDIWHSPQADQIRKTVRRCNKQCWMIGSVSMAMKKRLLVPTKWILSNKIKLFLSNGNLARLNPVC